MEEMIIMEGYTRTGTQKKFTLTKDKQHVIYMIDDVKVDAFSLHDDAMLIINEMNNIVLVSAYEQKYIDSLIKHAKQANVSFSDLETFYHAYLNAQWQDKKPDKELQNQKEVIKTAQKENETMLPYTSKEDFLNDLRLHLDDTINAFLRDNGGPSDWVDFSECLYTASNYLDEYVKSHNVSQLPCSLVTETCEDTINNQYQTWLDEISKRNLEIPDFQGS